MNGKKPRGRHPEKALTALAIKNLTKPGRYADGNGLYVVVDPSGAKRWVLRTVVQGRRRDMGLGSLQLVSLADARARATTYRRLARDGGDPVAEKRRASIVVPTFEEAARTTYAEHKKAWKNGKHTEQWLQSLAIHVFPVFGKRRVDQIETPDVLKALGPIWLTRPETARRVRQRIRTILDWAKTAGFRTGDNPADSVEKGLPRQTERKGHFAAIPYNRVSGFVARLRKSDAGEQVQLALEFLILTAARTGEVLEARWNEIDLRGRVWTIPADRMKAKVEHRVPLTDRAVAILKRAKELAPNSDHVFPGRVGDGPMSGMVFLMALRRMGADFTVHGFRSAFRDWAAETTSFPTEVCEMALAHTVRNKVEAAYRRGDLFEKRRELMAAWAEYATRRNA
jgi:integrase